jgi:hypothetical protein
MSVEIDLYRKQARLEVWKAVAVFVSAVVAVSALILTVAHIIK